MCEKIYLFITVFLYNLGVELKPTKMKTASELRLLRNESMLSIINSIMKLGFTRDEAGTLSSYVYPAIRFHEKSFIDNGMKMFKDKRHDKWADDTTLGTELKELFCIK
jgi:hypothetical protein